MSCFSEANIKIFAIVSLVGTIISLLGHEIDGIVASVHFESDRLIAFSIVIASGYMDILANIVSVSMHALYIHSLGKG